MSKTSENQNKKAVKAIHFGTLTREEGLQTSCKDVGSYLDVHTTGAGISD